MYSVDGGKTVAVLRGAPGGDDYHELWVDPKNGAHLVLGTDQGTTISLNRGKTWSTWYNQPTAQMYHVTTDDRFPFTVYGAQQDSGSAAVLSRTDHGQITPRDWFPAGSTESGYIAIDPKDPNIFYESGSYGVVARWSAEDRSRRMFHHGPFQSSGLKFSCASIAIPGLRHWPFRLSTRPRSILEHSTC